MTPSHRTLYVYAYSQSAKLLNTCFVLNPRTDSIKRSLKGDVEACSSVINLHCNATLGDSLIIVGVRKWAIEVSATGGGNVN